MIVSDGKAVSLFVNGMRSPIPTREFHQKKSIGVFVDRPIQLRPRPGQGTLFGAKAILNGLLKNAFHGVIDEVRFSNIAR